MAEGRYRFVMSHDTAHPGGDADLYVKVGQKPTASSFDCRPYSDGSSEECVVELGAPAKIFVVVRGYASQESYFRLVGSR